MATRYGSDRSFLSTNTGGVYDTDGNEVISSSNQFGSFPLGPAALAQTLFSVPNGTFNLLPPDLSSNVGPDNPLPYWDIPLDNSDNLMSSSVIFDTTTNTYALRLTPGSALSGDTYAITTRSAVISDDNLALRQKAIATLEKVGTYAGTTQVNLSLSATYYDALGSAISTQAIGTVFDNGTVSSITGFTTAGTAAVGISASYVDLTFTMTATANVTSGISFDVNTILLQTSQGGGGGGQASFVLTESFQSSGDFVVPTGVEYLLAVFAISGGGGGGGGGAISWNTTSRTTRGGGGGGGGRSALVQNLYIGDAGGTISVGIGAGGAGGTAASFSKTSGNLTQYFVTGGNGSSGGATTFGSYLSLNGGNAGTAGGTASTSGSGGTTATTSIGVYRGLGATGGAGGSNGGNAPSGGQSGAANLPWGAETSISLGSNGGSASFAGTAGGTQVLVTPGTASATVGIQGGGGAGGEPGAIAGTAGNGVAAGAGGGGGAYWAWNNATSGTKTVLGGVGGTGGANSGGGGGGGGGVRYQDEQSSYNNYAVAGTAGAGGAGGSGLVVVVYIG